MNKEDIWYERRNAATTCCSCDCCERAFYLMEDSKEPSAACSCVGLFGNLNEGQCHCWFCIETNGLKRMAAR